MSSNNFFRSDLFGIYNIVQASMLVYPKELVIQTLRDYFSKDSYYHFSKDQWGFPNVQPTLNMPLGADLPSGAGSHPDLSPFSPLSTRLFIGENFHYGSIFYPAIIVRTNGSRYVPISINREQGGVQYDDLVYQDGYGNEVVIRKPISLITAGAWEGSLTIDVLTRDLRARDDLVELIAMCFTEIHFNSLYDVGLIIKPISIGSPTETDDRADKLYRQSITMDIRTEYRREIPVDTIIDSILFAVEFVNLGVPNAPVAQNLTIKTEINVADTVLQPVVNNFL